MQQLMNHETQTMTLKEITDLLEVRHDKSMLKVAEMAKEPEFGTMSILDIVYNDKGQTIETYQLDKRQSIAVASRLNTALLMRIIDRWQELEAARPAALPDFSNPAQAARAWADQHEALMLEQSSHVDTKKALHHAVLTLENAEIQLDTSQNYFTIKRVAQINAVPWQTYAWAALKATGIPPVKIFDANYGEVNAYHRTAWVMAYPQAVLG